MEICESCSGQHSTMECQSRQMTVEQAQYVNQHNQPQQGQYEGNAYQNRYHNQNQNAGRGWRDNQNSQNNQNYGWRNSHNNMPLPRVNEPPPKKKVDFEQALAQMLILWAPYHNRRVLSSVLIWAPYYDCYVRI